MFPHKIISKSFIEFSLNVFKSGHPTLLAETLLQNNQLTFPDNQFPDNI